jgi:hypothetical protein
LARTKYALRTGEAVPLAELATLPETERWTFMTMLNVLRKGAAMSDEDRAEYYRQVDLNIRPKQELQQNRREKARLEIESGVYAEEDALPRSEWMALHEANYLARKSYIEARPLEAFGRKGEAGRASALNGVSRTAQHYASRALLRREMIKEATMGKGA